MSILHYIGGPLVGAVIGYCTNYIAVKMLFRPLREIKLCGFTLPFTPGIIPKRKNALAAAVGKAVGDSLLTEEDLAAMLLSEDVENTVAELCVSQVNQYFAKEETVKEELSALTGEESYDRGREALKQGITRKIMDGLQAMEPGKIIAEEGKNAVRQKLEGTMFAMFLSESLLDSLAGEIGAYAESYILENGGVYVEEQVDRELAGAEGKHLYEVKAWLPADEAAIREKICAVYRTCIEKSAASVVSQFRISEIVEHKIREMDVRELEELVMSVMQHELGMIVNLGALIGFVLGVLNLFF